MGRFICVVWKINKKNKIQQVVDKLNEKRYIISVKETMKIYGNHNMEGTDMLTRFGKQLRKIRIENDQRLKDMADKLEVTVAYLSAVENGNRKVPDAWVHIISKEYHLNEQEQIELQQAAYEDKKEIRISLEDAARADLALSFARKFKNMTNDDLNKLQEFLDTL